MKALNLIIILLLAGCVPEGGNQNSKNDNAAAFATANNRGFAGNRKEENGDFDNDNGGGDVDDDNGDELKQELEDASQEDDDNGEVVIISPDIRAENNEPVDGVWTPWGLFSSCSKNCGGGTKSRSRTCVPPVNGGKPCEGLSEETVACNTQICSSDGYWSSWTGWGPCSRSCGGGSQTRTRECLGQKGDGKDCDGFAVESRSCNTHVCPMDGYWSEWSDWGSCSKTCGGGTKKRTRSCIGQEGGGKTCEGVSEETLSCNEHECPIDGVWSIWSEWSSCTKTCGEGTKTRTRTCTPPQFGGQNCIGSSSETVSCNDQGCPVDGVWSEWSAWSGCSNQCGSGYKSRVRSCIGPYNGGAGCEGSTNETMACQDMTCPVDGYWSEWSSWSTCSAQCDGGTKSRTRTCTPPVNGGEECSGASRDIVSCNTQACEPETPDVPEEEPIEEGYVCTEADRRPWVGKFRTNYRNFYYVMNSQGMNLIESTVHRDCTFTLGVVIPNLGVLNFMNGRYRLNDFTRIAEECADYDGNVKIDTYVPPYLLYSTFYIDTNIWGTDIYAWKEGKARIRRCASYYSIKNNGSFCDWRPINTWDQFEINVSCSPRFCGDE